MREIVTICPVCYGTGWTITATDDPYGKDQPEVERCPACQKSPALTRGKEGKDPNEGEV